jgi:hypothetical protein
MRRQPAQCTCAVLCSTHGPWFPTPLTTRGCPAITGPVTSHKLLEYMGLPLSQALTTKLIQVMAYVIFRPTFATKPDTVTAFWYLLLLSSVINPLTYFWPLLTDSYFHDLKWHQLKIEGVYLMAHKYNRAAYKLCGNLWHSLGNLKTICIYLYLYIRMHLE